MNKREIIKEFNPSLDEYNLELISKLSEIEQSSFRGKELVSELERLILDNTAQLKNRIEDLSIKTNSALFGNRKFINESFAFEVPLKEIYFRNPENAEFKNNVLTTKVSAENSTKRVDLSLSAITSRRGTDFKVVDNTIEIHKNLNHNYQELEINLPKSKSSGHLHIVLDKYDSVSILDTFGRELVDKKITKEITQVINSNTNSIVLRFHTNKKKYLTFLSFYLTQETFTLSTEVETKPIRIGYPLSQIGINTCDNYSTDYTNIEYYVSVNGTDYKPIRPLNKQKNLHLNSIISVDTEESYYMLSDYDVIKGDTYFVTDTIPVVDMHIIRAFKYKLGEDEGLIRDRTIYLRIEKDIEVILHKDDKIILNDTPIEVKEDNFLIKISKGFNKIEANSNLLNETENFLNKADIKISDDFKTLSYRNVLDNKIYNKVIDYNPNDKSKNSLIYQLITQGDIFLEPVEAKKKSINNLLYIEKEDSLSNIHLFIKNRLLQVETVQLKIKL